MAEVRRGALPPGWGVPRSLVLVAALVAGCGGANVDESEGSSSPRSSESAPAGMSECEADRAVSDEPPSWLVRLGAIAGKQYSVAGDGTVVAVARTDIYASVDDYQTWRISDEAMRTVVEALAADDAQPLDDEFFDPLFVEVMDPCFGPAGNAWTSQAGSVLAAVTDPGLRVTEPTRWQPEALWIIVHPPDRLGSPNDASDPFAAWPLPGSIADHVVGHDTYRPDSDEAVPVRWACLTGDEVTPVWELQRPGSRNTWIRLEDAEGPWEVTIRPNWPGYRLSTDPCASDG